MGEVEGVMGSARDWTRERKAGPLKVGSEPRYLWARAGSGKVSRVERGWW